MSTFKKRTNHLHSPLLKHLLCTYIDKVTPIAPPVPIHGIAVHPISTTIKTNVTSPIAIK